MSIFLPMSNIPIISHDALDPYQAHQIATDPSYYETVVTYLSIDKEENMQDPVRLNISCILTDAYNEN